MTNLRKLVAVGLIAAPSGCSISIGTNSSSGGGVTGCCSSRTDGDVNYRVAYLSKGDGAFLVIVTDGTGGLVGSHSGSPAGGELGTLDGRTIIWECVTDDGKTGTVTIGGATYELEKGGLFLISARHGKTWVRQSKTDLSHLKGDVDLAAVKSAVSNDTITAEFLERIERPTPREPVTVPAGK